MSQGSINRFIVKPVRIEELVHHDIPQMEREVGPLFRFMNRDMVPEADVTLMVRIIERDPRESNVGPHPHHHEGNQLYCLLGEVEVEVTIEDETANVKGPASIFIPAGKAHAIRYRGGRGYLVNVLSRGEYQ